MDEEVPADDPARIFAESHVINRRPDHG